MRIRPRLRLLLPIAGLLAGIPLPAATAETPPDIFAVIKAHDVPRLQTLLDEQPQVLAQRSERGLSPLMVAAYLEHPDLVELLRRRAGALGFHEACVAGDFAAVRRLLARGEDVDRRSADGFTPLGLSVFFRQPAVARLLVDAGADLDAKATNSLQVAPVHAAVARADLATLELLLAHGADANRTQQRLMRPLHKAAASGNLPAVALLLMFGADPSARNEEDKTPADFARERGFTAIADRLERLQKP